MSWFITNLIAALLLPPLNILLLLIAGLFLHRNHPRLAKSLLGSGVLLLWLMSTPFVAEGALHWLESDLKPVSNQSAEAIVILGGGSYFHAPEYGGTDTVSRETLMRVRYGAQLQRATGKPILVTGGTPLGNPLSEAQQMRLVLTLDFHQPARWTEDRSDNTYENAVYSAQLLHAAGIWRVYLVSHAWHLPRAIRVFRQAGLEVVPAPTAFTTRYQTNLLSFIPDSHALENSRIAAHELIGLAWYWLKNEHAA